MSNSFHNFFRLMALGVSLLGAVFFTVLSVGCEDTHNDEIYDQFSYDTVEKDTYEAIENGSYDEKKDGVLYEDSMDASAPANVDVVLDPRTHTLVELFDYITDKDRRDEIADEIYAPESTFKDPIQSAQGREEIKKVLALLGLMLDGIDTVIKKDVVSDDVLAIHWDMTFKVKLWPFSATIPGVTWMDLNEEGKCIAQVDYWDLAYFIQQILIVQPLKSLLNMIPSYSQVMD